MLLIESFRREKCTVQTEQERARNGKRSPVDGCCMQENKIHNKRQNATWTSLIKAKEKERSSWSRLQLSDCMSVVSSLLGGRSRSFFAADRGR